MKIVLLIASRVHHYSPITLERIKIEFWNASLPVLKRLCAVITTAASVVQNLKVVDPISKNMRDAEKNY